MTIASNLKTVSYPAGAVFATGERLLLFCAWASSTTSAPAPARAELTAALIALGYETGVWFESAHGYLFDLTVSAASDKVHDKAELDALIAAYGGTSKVARYDSEVGASDANSAAAFEDFYNTSAGSSWWTPRTATWALVIALLVGLLLVVVFAMSGGKGSE
jgi:hypothetical protein